VAAGQVVVDGLILQLVNLRYVTGKSIQYNMSECVLCLVFLLTLTYCSYLQIIVIALAVRDAASFYE
jgi:hypothetical protein